MYRCRNYDYDSSVEILIGGAVHAVQMSQTKEECSWKHKSESVDGIQENCSYT